MPGCYARTQETPDVYSFLLLAVEDSPLSRLKTVFPDQIWTFDAQAGNLKLRG